MNRNSPPHTILLLQNWRGMGPGSIQEQDNVVRDTGERIDLRYNRRADSISSMRLGFVERAF